MTEKDSKIEIVNEERDARFSYTEETKPTLKVGVDTTPINTVTVSEPKSPHKETIATLQQALQHKVRGLKIACIGTGQAGTKLAEQFYRFGYPTCGINTAKQDLAFINIPEESKLYIKYALDGVGKDMSLGEDAYRGAREDILTLLKKTIPEDTNQLMICVGLGGGSGAGGLLPLIECVASFGLPIMVLCALPMTSEGATAKNNAIVTLDKLAQLSAQDIISALIVVDNARIEAMYPDISAAHFWKAANFDIVNNFHMFNALSACASEFESLDSMDLARILATGNCTIYGKTTVPVVFDGDQLVMYENELANALTRNLKEGLLVEGFDIGEATAAGVIFTGRREVLSGIPAININFAVNELNGMLGGCNLYRGMYIDDSAKDEIHVYTILSGLGLPKSRVQGLAEEAQNSVEMMESKTANKDKMNLLDALQSDAKQQSQYDKMRGRNNSFNRMVQKTKKRRF